VLTETEAIIGTSSWSVLDAEFSVQESCGVQSLRLEAASTYRHDHYFAGNLWFDDVKINKAETVGKNE
jgi:hypothetical protein